MVASGATACTSSVSSTSSTPASHGEADEPAKVVMTWIRAGGRPNRRSKSARSCRMSVTACGRRPAGAAPVPFRPPRQRHRDAAAVDPAIQQRLDAVGDPELPGCVTRLGAQAVSRHGARRAGRRRRCGAARSRAAGRQQVLAGVISPRRGAVAVRVPADADAEAPRWIGVGEVRHAVGLHALRVGKVRPVGRRPCRGRAAGGPNAHARRTPWPARRRLPRQPGLPRAAGPGYRRSSRPPQMPGGTSWLPHTALAPRPVVQKGR